MDYTSVPNFMKIRSGQDFFLLIWHGMTLYTWLLTVGIFFLESVKSKGKFRSYSLQYSKILEVPLLTTPF